jgi:hypothetical protein
VTQLERLIGLTVVTYAALAAQNVTVAPGKWRESGIEITSYSSPIFATKLAAAAGDGIKFDVTPLLPFSFFLTNNTGHKIIAYSVLWTVTYPSGFVARHQRLVGSLLSPNGKLAMPTGTERLVTVVNETVSPTAENPQTSLSNAVKIFPTNGDVIVSLEAVVLDDGIALGPDTTHAVARMNAQVDAEAALSLEIVSAFDSGGDPAMLDLLAGIVSSKDPNAPSALTASRMSSPSDAYDTFLTDFRNHLARHYLGIAKTNPGVLLRLVTTKLNQAHLTVQQ